MSESNEIDQSPAPCSRGWRYRVSGLLGCGVALALAVAITGCGGSGGSGSSGGLKSGVAAEVAGQSVSTASLEHWIPIEAVISKETSPKHPPVPGEIPDPPSYAACVGYRRDLAASDGAITPKPSAQQLKTQCQQEYEHIRQHMLQILISFRWLEAEAVQLGVKLSDQEVNAAFERFKKESFGGEAGFQKYLKYSGETVQDELLIVKMDQISSKIQAKVLKERGIPGARKYYEAFPKRWAAKTTCRAGYVIPLCKQYKGPTRPEASI